MLIHKEKKGFPNSVLWSLALTYLIDFDRTAQPPHLAELGGVFNRSSQKNDFFSSFMYSYKARSL